MVDSKFSDTLQLIYAAGLDFKQWPAVLERLAELLGPSMTCLVRHDVATSEGAMVTVRADPEVARRYAEHYAKLNVFAQRAGNRPAGTCMTDRAVLAKEELFKTEFYADFLRPEDVHSILSVYVLPEDGTRVAFGRPHRFGEWEQEHVDRLSRFAPHLHRAALINLKLGASQLDEMSATEALDRLARGVIIVDAKSRPCQPKRNRDSCRCRWALRRWIRTERRQPIADRNDPTHDLRGLRSERRPGGGRCGRSVASVDAPSTLRCRRADTR
jgi:hypothetical protein